MARVSTLYVWIKQEETQVAPRGYDDVASTSPFIVRGAFLFHPHSISFFSAYFKIWGTKFLKIDDFLVLITFFFLLEFQLPDYLIHFLSSTRDVSSAPLLYFSTCCNCCCITNLPKDDPLKSLFTLPHSFPPPYSYLYHMCMAFWQNISTDFDSTLFDPDPWPCLF